MEKGDLGSYPSVLLPIQACSSVQGGQVGEGRVVCCACRHISLKVAMAVIKMAHSEGHLGSAHAARALETSDEELAAFIIEHMYKPDYKPLVSLPVGVLE